MLIWKFKLCDFCIVWLIAEMLILDYYIDSFEEFINIFQKLCLWHSNHEFEIH